MSLPSQTPTITAQRTSSHATQYYEYNEPFFAVVIQGIPWIFTSTKDERLTAATLGAGAAYSSYTLKPVIKSFPLELVEEINFFNFNFQSPGSFSVSLVDKAYDLSALFSQLNTAKTKLTQAETAATATLHVTATSAVTTDTTKPLYCEKETISFAGNTATTYTGCTRGAFGSTAEALSAGAVVSLYPRYWKGRRVTILHGDLRAPTSATTLFRGVVAGLKEVQLGEFNLSIDDALRMADRPLNNVMRAQAQFVGRDQISVFVPYGERLPKRPDDFQTTYRGGEYGVFPQFDGNLAQHFLKVEKGSQSDYFSFQRGLQVNPTAGTCTSCEIMPVVNGDFDEWDFQILGDLDQRSLETNALAGRNQTVMARFQPMGWTVEGDALQVTGGYDGKNFTFNDPITSFYSPTGYVGPTPGCEKDDSYDGHIHKSKNTGLGFFFGMQSAPLRVSTQFTLYTDDDFTLIYRERADTASDYYIVLQDVSTLEYYQWDGTWSSTSNQKTVTANTSLSWTKISQSVTVDRPRTVRLYFGNTKADGSINAITSSILRIDDVVVSISGIYDTAFTEYGPAVVTFYNTHQTGTTSDSIIRTNYDESVGISGGPKASETLVLKGSPVSICNAILRSVDGNATDVYDVLPDGLCLGLTANEVDQTTLDYFGHNYSGPSDVTLFIDEPFQALPYLQQNVFSASASWLAIRNAKISLVGLKTSLTDYVASASGGSFSAAASSTDFRGYTREPIYSSGAEYISNQIKANVFLRAPQLRSGTPARYSQTEKANFVVNATGDSAAYFGQGLNPISFETGIYTADFYGTQIISVASRWFQRFSLGMPYYTFETDFSLADTVFIGDIIKLTLDNVYSASGGSRGVTSLACWIWSKKINFESRTITWCVSPQPPDANPGYIAPALNVVSNVATVVTVSASQYSSGTDAWGNTDKDIYHFPDTGSLKYLLYKPTTGDTQLGTYSAISYASNTITLDSVPAWIAAGCVITLSTYSAFAAGDEGISPPRIFFADSATGLITGSVGAYTYA